MKIRAHFSIACLLLTPLGTGQVVSAADDPPNYLDMSLSELLSLEITSVSKKPQSISHAAAAVFVITRDDIRRSGVTAIPEALRMAPGVQVARIDGNKWAISSRGFNGRFANKLLVLMDGRTVYSPTFGGVYWDVQDTMLEDIERIEVIRGPGASLWGSNAVNGVINIITRSAAQTQGGLLSAGAGNQELGFGGLRYGGGLGEIGNYRVYAKYFNRDNNRVLGSGASANDQWDQFRTGFRADLTPSSDDQVTVQGDYYHGRAGELVNTIMLAAPWQQIVRDSQQVEGFNFLTNWHHVVSSTDSLNVQAYYDQTQRWWTTLDERRHTADLDLQYRTQRFDSHDVLLGFGYRYTEDFTNGSHTTYFSPANRGTQLYSAFLQDDIELIKDTLTLTLGSKLEHNDYTGFEGQPNARLLWTPDSQNTLWASVGRAVRIPTRADANANAIAQYIPANMNPFADKPILARFLGSDQFDAESVIAYEAGFKHQWSQSLSFDAALFYNQYTRLRSTFRNDPICRPGGGSGFCLISGDTRYWELPVSLRNQGKMDTYGAELAVEWKPFEQWRLQGSYSYLHQDPRALPEKQTVADDWAANPIHQLSLRSSWSPRDDLDFDLWLRYVDRINAYGELNTAWIPAYTQMDLRLAWRPLAKLELSIAGFNLLDDQHPEFYSEKSDIPQVEIRRSIFGQVRLEF